MPDRLRALDLAEAFQLSHAVFVLHDLGIFAALKKPMTAEALSATHSLDPVLLRGILEYVAARTNLLRKSGARFVATRKYLEEASFLINLYIGAYGGNASQLAELLRHPSAASGAVDQVHHAQAFAAVAGPSLGLLPAIVRQLGFNHLLDLGCGNGALLVELAERDSQFVGWGVDLNPAMCKLARTIIRAARLGKRVRILEGDCRKLSSVLPQHLSARIRALTACNVANEMFRDGHSQAIAWLRSLRESFRGKPLLIADYYGRLGRKGRASRETLLHDYAQLISGQGVPPASAAEWRSIYAQADCQLAHIIEDKATTRFIHVLHL